ncbi:MAG: carboxypeptidase-like regulatory domain-containing protein [Gemmatimonadaceae bacterium]|nr:carboxypeptidase-like regulatory domain-containing protein [Gemmatimonadaceae bacterium]
MPPTQALQTTVDPALRGSVVGRIARQHSGAAIGAATLILLPGGAETRADGAGAFRSDSVPAGRHVLVARSIGFRIRRDTLFVPDAGGLRVAVALDMVACDECPGNMLVRVRRPWWRRIL